MAQGWWTASPIQYLQLFGLDPVTSSFSVGGEAKTCLTGSNGSCTVTSSVLSTSNTASTTFSVGGITGSGMRYDASKNSTSSITVNRPRRTIPGL